LESLLPNRAPTIEDCSFVYFAESTSTRILSYAVAHDSDGKIVTYQWILSDGYSCKEQTFAYQFNSSGAFYATLMVYDDKGAVVWETITIVFQNPFD